MAKEEKPKKSKRAPEEPAAESTAPAPAQQGAKKPKAAKPVKGEAKPAKGEARPAKGEAKPAKVGKAEKAEKGEKRAAQPEVQVEPRKAAQYREKVVPHLMARFGYKNAMQVPRLRKIVINMGVGEAIQNPKAIDGAMADLQFIAGQKPNIRRARKSVSNFKLRAGMAIGCAVTLRRRRMWEFFDRLTTFAIPRIRDFRGLARRGFDGRGNFTFGLKEQLIFPEIDYDSVDQIRGMDVSFVTSARTDEEGLELLSELGMPFVRQS